MLKPTKRNKKQKVSSLNFELQNIVAKTDNQQKVFDLYDEGKNLFLYGSAGCGKSFLSLAIALKDMMDNGSYQKIIIFRSAVASRDLGFLPGTEKEKIAVYEAPYKSIVNELFGRDDAYSILVDKDIIQFESTSFLRGLTYNNSLMFIDEIENMSFQELSTIYTRVGQDTRIILAGDIKQCDLNLKREISGFSDILSISKEMPSFGFVEFTLEDCVRSGFAKEFLIAQEKLGF